MRNWDDLKYCCALSRHGTMSDAAKVLGTNVATVSRRLQRLSDEVGQTLFVKEGNRWIATEAGAGLARLGEQIQSQIGSAAFEADAEERDVNIRISCALQVMQCGMVDGIVDFLADNPRARLALYTTKLSLALNECDIRIGFEKPTKGRVVRRQLTELPLVPACRAGFADQVSGWINVNYTGQVVGPAAAFHAHFGAPPKVDIEGLNLTRRIMRNTPLVAALPQQMVGPGSDFVPYPIAGAEQKLPIWVSYHEARRLDPAVRLAVQFLESTMIDAELPEENTRARA